MRKFYRLDAGNFVRILDKKQGMQAGCPEDITFGNGWIEKLELSKAANVYKNSYKECLNSLLKAI